VQQRIGIALDLIELDQMQTGTHGRHLFVDLLKRRLELVGQLLARSRRACALARRRPNRYPLCNALNRGMSLPIEDVTSPRHVDPQINARRRNGTGNRVSANNGSSIAPTTCTGGAVGSLQIARMSHRPPALRCTAKIASCENLHATNISSCSFRFQRRGAGYDRARNPLQT
jgi:hypothetical protein